jgi:predicted ATPase
MDSAHPGRGSPLAWLTPLVGREAELDRLTQLLERNRLVTLTGAGGVGKTRLALELAGGWSALAPERRLIVELAVIEPSDATSRSPEPVAGAIWRALRSAAPGAVTPSGPTIDDVAGHYADQPGLLVLDNCEHLSGAAAISELLLRRCPELRILATSRRALVLPGEIVSQVPPLTLPADSEDALNAVHESEAGRLFSERAVRSLPSFSVTGDSAPAVAEICRRLDGLALAIELAAARVAILSPNQILDGLDDRFALLAAGPASSLGRHRTLRASLDWSYELMSEDAQAVLRCLSAAPDWSLEAIKATQVSGREVLDALSDLLDAGLLVTVDDGGLRRYRLLETVRAYARERLDATGEERSVRRAHMEYFRALTADASQLLMDDAGRRRLESESQNLYAALEFAAAEEPALALEMAADLRHWLPVSGRSAEALALCSRMLEAPVAPESNVTARCHVLHTGAQLAIFAEDYARARAYAMEALPLAQGSGDEGVLGIGLVLAASGKRAADPAASAELGSQAVTLLRRSGDRHDLAVAVAQLALTEALRDRFGAARELCHELGTLLGGRPPSWLAVWIEITLAWAIRARRWNTASAVSSSRAAGPRSATTRRSPTSCRRWSSSATLSGPAPSAAPRSPGQNGTGSGWPFPASSTRWRSPNWRWTISRPRASWRCGASILLTSRAQPTPMRYWHAWSSPSVGQNRCDGTRRRYVPPVSTPETHGWKRSPVGLTETPT